MRKDGFTLLEVLIALAILSGVLVTLIHTLNYNLSVLQRHEVITVASLLAKEKLSEAMRLHVTEDSGKFPVPFEDYAFELRNHDSPIPDVVVVEITVKKAKEQVVLRTLYKKQ
ncbi:type II secretion system protein GspI [Candidatus Magnetobacterium bavaricum]|uniref:Type II secretion system protein GspI n=1 Tax=Candidatus Magnetobacterium bavaricum TaxID=29290 RepID=A0A0F3GY98_9BACT|nr:type II secretion system protein GspI [Candidatus Magnetobacterium bavaricum]